MEGKRWLFSCALVMSFITHQVVHARTRDTQGNEVQKIFHHQGTLDNNKPSIELGKIVFYFSQEPIINRLPSLTDGTTVTLFFPGTKLSREAGMALTALASDNNSLYQLKCASVTKPIKGIKCDINFDPAQVSFEYSLFDSIKLNKGLVFRFFNKQLLDAMSKQERSVLRVVSNNKKPRIVIDCGHGGTDAGAIGCFALQEKNVTLDVGLKVASLLKKKGLQVVLTRDGDHTLALDERTSYVNTKTAADLLISIHANFAANKEAAGIETFCLNETLFKSQFCALTTDLSKLVESYTHDLYKQSSLLAHAVHKNAIANAQKKYAVTNRSIKNSVSQILVGTTIPSALIEIGFLSNEHEAQLLADHEYQNLLAQGICNGVITYLALRTA